ncbi:methyl-accepting chemotaxis protein [Bosea sp. AAP35]|uniref:methyl-accepting chemotaxis protein n=1 Tax=Bosea sp. AAP35 TaxID=1523417 RepID=UPI0009E92149|nr:methyl-accepting chemotaxis protein [Bosea sp. AAP35]
MDFRSDTEARLIALNIDARTLDVVRSLAPAVKRGALAALAGYYSRWLVLPKFRGYAKTYGDSTAACQSEFHGALFADAFDEGYEERLRNLLELEKSAGFGVRIHLAAATIAARVAFDEIGRRSWWSGRRAARQCEAVMRLIVVDGLNALQLEQEQMSQALRERHATIESAIAGFSVIADEVEGIMGSASIALGATAEITEAAVKTARCDVSCATEAARQSASNIHLTATASQQIKESIENIDHFARQSLTAITDAAGTVTALKEEMTRLAAGVEQINGVVATIASIAQQTNLLALNATIEAARAGEAGRGFSVVANEVKLLAGETSNATHGIASQIEGIHHSTYNAINQLDTVINLVAQVSNAGSATSAAVGEQAAATAQIAAQTEQAAREVAVVDKAANQVHGSITSLGEAAGTMTCCATDLATQSSKFQTALARFVERLRAA